MHEGVNMQLHEHFPLSIRIHGHFVSPCRNICYQGYGQDGPYKERSGYDVIAAGMGGLMHITGPEVIFIQSSI